jgi:DNA-binding MarR family transcriptional regulator/ribosomal protein S18 acetylase RimI-like enzyme
MASDPIAAVRRFNRLVTKRTGALEDHFLGRDRPLGESRVLWEIGHEGADLRDLRARLDLDSGYLSRLVHSLASKGLVAVDPDPADERVRRARLTDAGRAEVDDMDRRSDEAAVATLAPLTASQRERLVAAMTEITRLLGLAGARVERLDPADVRARRCVARYFEELDERFEGGFDPTASIAAVDADLVPPGGAFLAVTVDGEAVACGALKRIDPEVASLKRMWVDPSFRGLGLGRRILAALEDQARELGFTLVRLETNGALAEAVRLYRASGYREVEAFNDDPYAQHWFEKRLG